MLPVFFLFKKRIRVIGPMGFSKRSDIWNVISNFLLKQIAKNLLISIRMSTSYAEETALKFGLKILPERAIQVKQSTGIGMHRNKVLVLADNRVRKNFDATLLFVKDNFNHADVIIVGDEIKGFNCLKKMDKRVFDEFLHSSIGTYVSLSVDEGFSSLIEECLLKGIKIVSYRVGILRDKFFDDYITNLTSDVILIEAVNMIKIVSWMNETKRRQLAWFESVE
jgi:hypothetical protein